MSISAQPAGRISIDPRSTVGTVRLTVGDLERSRAFYERALGLVASESDDGALALGPDQQNALIELLGDSSAPALDRRATGLFHVAILMPNRRELAFALARLANARWPLDGASDHLVSEALYLSDPDGNGIEIYRDRPREQWPRSGEQLEMATLPLDLDDIAAELAGAGEVPPRAPAGTRVGHVHLQVSELEETERFYSDILGFDVTVRGYPGALFVSAGGYHHHIGLNTWHSAGAPPPDPGSIGLRSYDVVLPDEAERGRVTERARAAGIEVHDTGLGPMVRDPSANAVVLRTSG